MSLRWMLSASPNRAYLRDRESNLILLLWSIFTQFILILQEAFVQLERSTFVLVSYAVICSVLWYMVLILILIGGDYIIWSLLVVVSCYASSTLDQHKTTCNPCATCKILSFMPKDSTDAQPVRYKKSFQAFLIKAIMFGSGPRAVRYT